MRPHRIAISLGDPAGIGPELTLRVLSDQPLRAQAHLLVHGSAALLRRVSQASGVPWPPDVVELGPGEAMPTAAAAIVDHGEDTSDIEPGRVSAAAGRLAAGWIRRAAAAVQRGEAEALVTGPICKESVQAAGEHFPGHTELLAELTGAASVRMMFWSPALQICLATIHVPLSEVPRSLTAPLVLETIRAASRAVRGAGGSAARIGVLALNPHAGERGLFGREEERVIRPAIEAARREGLQAEGPLVPDAAFLPALRRRYDVFVAMYHDQGLIPFKMLAFEEGVNVTVGLPFIRTSPDHGTAFDLAWQGKASAGSFRSAIVHACHLLEMPPA